MTTSPTPTRSGPSWVPCSTAPTAKPAMSRSSGAMTPGCSAVSPPISAQPASRQPSVTPATTAPMRAGSTFPVAM